MTRRRAAPRLLLGRLPESVVTEADGDGDSPEFPSRVMVSDSAPHSTLCSLQGQRQRVALPRARGYATVASDGGYILAHGPRVIGGETTSKGN